MALLSFRAMAETTNTWTEQREDVLRTAKAMLAAGLVAGTSGNVSARVEGGFLITPSAVPYEELTPADMVFMALDGTWSGRPSGVRGCPRHRTLYVDNLLMYPGFP